MDDHCLSYIKKIGKRNKIVERKIGKKRQNVEREKMWQNSSTFLVQLQGSRPLTACSV